MITKEELDAIRFYMGDQEIVDLKIYKGGPKAYNTINALLHKGIQNEIDKVKEGRFLEIEDSEHLQSYLSLILDIYHAMNKYLKDNENKSLVTYRIDRLSTAHLMMNQSTIEGFFSTCKCGYLEEYAHIKKNVILLEIIRKDDVPYLDFEELFKEKYAKSEEAEILLPFDTMIDSIQEISLSEEEKVKYTDMNGNEPVGKYQVVLSRQNYEMDTYQRINYDYLIDDETIQHVQKCLNELMNTQSLNEEDLEFYCNYKEMLQGYIRRQIVLNLNK